MTGEERSFKDIQWERVLCQECRKELVKGSLVAHRQTQHGMEKGGSGQVGEEEGGGNGPRTFRIAFPVKSVPRPLPVEWCSGRAATWTEMWVNSGTGTYGTPW